MNENEKKLIAILAAVSLVCGVAIGNSLMVHYQERKKRKLLEVTMVAFKKLQNSDPYTTGTAEERKKLIDDFVDEHILTKK